MISPKSSTKGLGRTKGQSTENSTPKMKQEQETEEVEGWLDYNYWSFACSRIFFMLIPNKFLIVLYICLIILIF